MLRAALLHLRTGVLDSGPSLSLQSINTFVFTLDTSSVVVLCGGLVTQVLCLLALTLLASPLLHAFLLLWDSSKHRVPARHPDSCTEQLQNSWTSH